MLRTFSSAVLASAALLASAGAASAQTAAYYVATPTTAPTKARLMTRDTAWQAKDGVLLAARSASREMIACQLVAREAGTLTGFSAGGRAFDAAELGKCNAKAGAAPVAVANAN